MSAADRAVSRSFLYDPLGRVTRESLTVQQLTQLDVQHSPVPLPGGQGWEHAVTYPSGTGLVWTGDGAGRTASLDLLHGQGISLGGVSLRDATTQPPSLASLPLFHDATGRISGYGSLVLSWDGHDRLSEVRDG